MIITIDGPAGVGKGTLSKNLAAHLGFHYLDTGTLYRATAFICLKDNCDLQNTQQTAKAAISLLERYDFKPTEAGFCTFIDGENVQRSLRADEVGSAASVVAAQTEVRQALKAFQQQFAQEKGADKGVIMDGRDTGTAICPDADVKFFLEADPKIRAERRVKELQDMGKSANFDEIYQAMVERDARDANRKTDPLIPAKDAHILDTSMLCVEEVLQKALSVITSESGK